MALAVDQHVSKGFAPGGVSPLGRHPCKIHLCLLVKVACRVIQDRSECLDGFQVQLEQGIERAGGDRLPIQLWQASDAPGPA